MIEILHENKKYTVTFKHLLTKQQMIRVYEVICNGVVTDNPKDVVSYLKDKLLGECGIDDMEVEEHGFGTSIR